MELTLGCGGEGRIKVVPKVLVQMTGRMVVRHWDGNIVFFCVEVSDEPDFCHVECEVSADI